MRRAFFLTLPRLRHDWVKQPSSPEDLWWKLIADGVVRPFQLLTFGHDGRFHLGVTNFSQDRTGLLLFDVGFSEAMDGWM